MRLSQCSWRRALWQDCGGTAMIEFAITFPVLLLLYIGVCVFSDAIGCSRKVTIATRALTDLAARYPSLTEAETTTILNAGAQVLSPYDPENAAIVLSEIKVTDPTHASVVWSKALNSSAITDKTVAIPSGLAATDTYLIQGKVTYTYTPALIFGNITKITLTDTILMLPRVSEEIPLT